MLITSPVSIGAQLLLLPSRIAPREIRVRRGLEVLSNGVALLSDHSNSQKKNKKTKQAPLDVLSHLLEGLHEAFAGFAWLFRSVAASTTAVMREGRYGEEEQDYTPRPRAQHYYYYYCLDLGVS